MARLSGAGFARMGVGTFAGGFAVHGWGMLGDRWEGNDPGPACRMDRTNNRIGSRLGSESSVCEEACMAAPLQNSP